MPCLDPIHLNLLRQLPRTPLPRTSRPRYQASTFCNRSSTACQHHGHIRATSSGDPLILFSARHTRPTCSSGSICPWRGARRSDPRARCGALGHHTEAGTTPCTGSGIHPCRLPLPFSVFSNLPILSPTQTKSAPKTQVKHAPADSSPSAVIPTAAIYRFEQARLWDGKRP